MLISQILKEKPTQGVITVAPGTRVAEAAGVLSEKRIGAVVVSSDGAHPEGIVSERDIVRELGRRGTPCLDDTVDQIMTRELTCCAPSDRAIAVMRIMTEKRFRHMPVVEDGKMVGFVSIGDVVKARLDELSRQAEDLKAMIMGY